MATQCDVNMQLDYIRKMHAKVKKLIKDTKGGVHKDLSEALLMRLTNWLQALPKKEELEIPSEEDIRIAQSKRKKVVLNH